MYLEHLRVPIPDDDARITEAGEVQTKLYNRDGSRRVWTTIGRLPETGPLYGKGHQQLMIPNGVYRLWYHAFYKEDLVDKDPDNIPPFFTNGAGIGPFALFLGAVTQSGLYDLLLDIFGIETANAILDIAMSYNMGEDVDLEDLGECLEDHLVFSVRPHSRAWYSYQLEPYSDAGDCEISRRRRSRPFPPKKPGSGITEEKIAAFLRRWAALRQKANPGDTVLHLDGTAAGKKRGARSKQNKWGALAVCETGGDYPGLPLAYHLYGQPHPERSDAQNALDRFRDLGLHPKRIIADAPLLWPQFFSTCKALQIPWLILLGQYSLGHETMLRRHEEDLIMGRGTPIAARNPMAAVGEDNVLLFGPGTPEAALRGSVGLYCLPKSAAERRDSVQAQLDKTYQEACTVLDQLQGSPQTGDLPIPAGDRGSAADAAMQVLYRAVCKAGGPLYSPDPQAWNCLKLAYHPEEGTYRCEIDADIARHYRCAGNFVSLASPDPMDLQAMSDALPLSYHLGDRDFAPTFSAMHAQLNSKAAGPFPAWFFVAYIADIVRALLLPSFRQFMAARDGELREEAREGYPAEELERTDSPVFVSIGAMLSWLRDIRFVRSTASADDMAIYGSTQGVRGAVLEASGIRPAVLPEFHTLAEAAEDPGAVRDLRQQKRTIPALHTPKKCNPKQDIDKGETAKR